MLLQSDIEVNENKRMTLANDGATGLSEWRKEKRKKGMKWASEWVILPKPKPSTNMPNSKKYPGINVSGRNLQSRTKKLLNKNCQDKKTKKEEEKEKNSLVSH